MKNFRTIDVPCCGNCKYFRQVDYGENICEHPHSTEPDENRYSHGLLIDLEEYHVCDEFEPKGGAK